MCWEEELIQLVGSSFPFSGQAFQSLEKLKGQEQDKRETRDTDGCEGDVGTKAYAFFLFFPFELCLQRVEERATGEGATEKRTGRLPRLWPMGMIRTTTPQVVLLAGCRTQLTFLGTRHSFLH